MARKRHSAAEIAVKLEQAEAMVAQGHRQIDICRSLGISVMTFHRWRRPKPETLFQIRQESGADALPPAHGSKNITDLQLENARLRQLVTDLLLEKISLEESQEQIHRPG